MKIKIAPYLALCAFVVMFLFSGCGKSALIVTVNFGNPPKGGGACSGKGICSAVVQPQGNPALSPTDITTTFMVSPTDKNILIMSFSMAELQQKQPNQASNFVDGGTYTFDGPFDLSDQSYAPLKLAPKARIDSTCQSTVKIKAGVVFVSYTYLHQ